MRTDTLLCLGTSLLSIASAAPAPLDASLNVAGVASVDVSISATAASSCNKASSTGSSKAAGSPAPAAFTKLHDTYVKNTVAALTKTCNPSNLRVRKAWDDLCDTERKDYLRAVNCLAAKPAKTDKSLCPGAKNRLDDFTYIHINQTNIIHNSGSLLSWHRQFLFGMENALRDECGYKGYLPYWDTGRFAEDQTKSPVFDGSDTSFGDAGKLIDKNITTGYIPGLATGPFPLPILHGEGGGCVQSGPFKNLTLSLGPVVVPNPDPNNLYGYKANPRCLSRDLNQPASAGNLTWDRLTELAGMPDMKTFRPRLEPTLHLQGHLSIGGEGADPFTPCNDPVFYLFHAQIDRIWAIWQGQDLKNRTYAIDGPRTFFGIPLADNPNANPPSNSSAEITDIMDLGQGGKMPIKAGMNPIADGHCYIYM